jgi:defect-in-organelle-trafficking protein DotC
MRKINFWIIIFFVSMLAACSSSHKQDIDPTNLEQLQSLSYEPPADPGSTGSAALSAIRVKALEDTAMSLAAQGGLSWASTKINERLEKDKWYLETIYNFNGMMLSHGVLPPVLEEGDNSLNLADSSTIRIADKTYKIIAQARFATTPPNWRDYLWMSFYKPDLPTKFLLPKNREESRIWAKAIKVGWDKGIQQAFSIFQQNLARIKRDYRGMTLYRKLLAQRMISPPFVSKTELGVTGNGNDMRINDQVLRITEMPKLQTESSGWHAIVVKQDDDTGNY